MNDSEDRTKKNDLCIGDRLSSINFSGVTSTYAVTANNQECVVSMSMAYSFEELTEPSYQTRGYRQDRRLRGKKNKRLPDCALRDEVIVVPGAGMAPEDVIAALQTVIHLIRKEGQWTGRTSKNLYCLERIGKVPRCVSGEDSDVAIEDT